MFSPMVTLCNNQYFWIEMHGLGREMENYVKFDLLLDISITNQDWFSQTRLRSAKIRIWMFQSAPCENAKFENVVRRRECWSAIFDPGRDGQIFVCWWHLVPIPIYSHKQTNKAGVTINRLTVKSSLIRNESSLIRSLFSEFQLD